jgi:hypothetical protein
LKKVAETPWVDRKKKVKGVQMKELGSDLSVEHIEDSIFLVRGQKVMLSSHLARLYGVEPRSLVQAVKRNIKRFPEDFMFQLTSEEFDPLKSQIVISSWGGLQRARPEGETSGIQKKMKKGIKKVFAID